MLISRSGLAKVLLAVLVGGCAGNPIATATPTASGGPSSEAAPPAPTTAAASSAVPTVSSSAVASPSAVPTVSPHPSPGNIAAFTTPVPPDAETPWAGISWRKLAPGDPLARIESVLRWSGGFVALGAPVAVGGTSRTPVWASTDGASWHPLDTEVFGPATIVIGVGETAGGIVALTLQGGRNHCDPEDPAAAGLVCWTLATPLQGWTSPDGASWTAHPGPDLGLVPSCDGCGLDVPLLEAGTPGVVVFNGGKPDAPPARRVQAAFSADGITWETLPAGAFPAGFSIGNIAAFGPGFIAVGTTSGAQTRAVALPSRDGRHWVSRDLPTSGLVAQAGTDTIDAAAGANGLIVEGVSNAGVSGPLLWWSLAPDGAWSLLNGFPPLGSWAALDGPVPDGTLLGDGERMLAYRSGRTPAAWTSSDGRSWRTMTISPTGPTNAEDWLQLPILMPIGVLGTGDDGSTWFGAPLT